MTSARWAIVLLAIGGLGRACSAATEETALRMRDDVERRVVGDPCSPTYADQRYILEHEQGVDVRCAGERE